MIRTTKENQDDEGNGTSFRNELHQERINPFIQNFRPIWQGKVVHLKESPQ